MAGQEASGAFLWVLCPHAPLPVPLWPGPGPAVPGFPGWPDSCYHSLGELHASSATVQRVVDTQYVAFIAVVATLTTVLQYTQAASPRVGAEQPDSPVAGHLA